MNPNALISLVLLSVLLCGTSPVGANDVFPPNPLFRSHSAEGVGLLQMASVQQHIHRITSSLPFTEIQQSSSPARPMLPTHFSAKRMTYTLGSVVYTQAYMYYNEEIQGQLVSYDNPAMFMKPFSVRTSIYQLNQTGALLLNDKCADVNTSFSPLFEWAKYTSYAGSTQLGPAYDNAKCDTWQLYSEHANLTLYTQEDTPVRLAISLRCRPGFIPGKDDDCSKPFLVDFGFHELTAAPPASVFEIPVQCSQPSKQCTVDAAADDEGMEKDEAEGERGNGPHRTQVLSMYVAHPSYELSQYNLSNVNLADALGDTVFTCIDVISNFTAIDHYTLLSYYEIEIDSTFGEYALCNGYPGECTGGDEYYVGREASMGVKELCGQCTDNSDTGSWYSLPIGGMCNSTASKEGKDEDSLGLTCTWRVKQRVKTVQLDCLFETLGMHQACLQEQTLPFTKTKSLLLRAVDVNDDSCEDVPPPPSSFFSSSSFSSSSSSVSVASEAVVIAIQ